VIFIATAEPRHGGEKPMSQLRDQLKNAFAGMHDRLRQSMPARRVLVLLVMGMLVALVGLWIADKLVYYYLARHYVEQLGDAFDLNKNLVSALGVLSFIAALFFRIVPMVPFGT
jgi:hypothetical protein